VQYYNEATGLLTFYDPAHPTTSNGQFKFPMMQNAVNMGATSIIKTFNEATYTPTFLRRNGES